MVAPFVIPALAFASGLWIMKDPKKPLFPNGVFGATAEPPARKQKDVPSPNVAAIEALTSWRKVKDARGSEQNVLYFRPEYVRSLKKMLAAKCFDCVSLDGKRTIPGLWAITPFDPAGANAEKMIREAYQADLIVLASFTTAIEGADALIYFQPTENGRAMANGKTQWAVLADPQLAKALALEAKAQADAAKARADAAKSVIAPAVQAALKYSVTNGATSPIVDEQVDSPQAREDQRNS